MPYSVFFTREADKDYDSLESNMKTRVNKALLKLAESPFIGKVLSGDLKGLRSFRIGKYRILYNSDNAAKQILIYIIGLRKNVYDR